MEKLIELLNEYENTLEPNEQMVRTKNWVRATPLVIISKQYWFIKWLVENEEIEWEKFQEPKIRGIIWLISNWHNSEWKSYKDYSKELAYESLLMLLSIQDEPIEFLVSILK